MYIVSEVPLWKYFRSSVKYLSGTLSAGMKNSNLKSIVTFIQPYKAMTQAMNHIVSTENRPCQEVSSGAYTVAMNFSTADEY